MNSSQQQYAVKDLIPKKIDNMQAVVEKQIEQDADLAGQKIPGFARRIVAERATQVLREALKKSVFLILPAGWSRAPEFAEFVDAAAYPADNETTLFLGEHDFEIEYKPIVTLKIAGVERPLLRFKLILKPQIRAASITIKNGHIISIGKCDCSVSAELKHLGGADYLTETSLHKATSPKLELAEPIELDTPGVRISPMKPNPN